VDALCQKYGCLPSQLRKEDAQTMMWMQALLVEDGKSKNGE